MTVSLTQCRDPIRGSGLDRVLECGFGPVGIVVGHIPDSSSPHIPPDGTICSLCYDSTYGVVFNTTEYSVGAREIPY